MKVRLTRRQVVAVEVVLACAVVPPVLGRAFPGSFDGAFAGTLAAAACFAAMALSLNVLMGYAGQISLGHGALLGVGGYSAGLIAGRYYLPMGFGLVVAAAAGAAFALVVGFPALRLRGLYLAITTVGFTVVMEACVFKLPWLSRGSAGLEIPRPYLGATGLVRNADYLAVVLLAVLALWLLDVNLTRTRVGRAYFGIRESERVAQSFGIDVARFKLGAFALSGAMAGVAGALYGHLVFFVNSDTFRFDRFSLLLVVLVVIGGLGSRLGVVVAAAAYAVLPEVFDAVFRWDGFDQYELIIGSALLIDAMVRNPGGFAEAVRERRDARRRGGLDGATDDDDDDVLPSLPQLPRPAALSDRAPVDGDAPLLEAQEIDVRYGGLLAVAGASITVRRGSIVGLIGPNGAGKSSLFDAIGGFVPIRAGQIRIAGHDVTERPPHERAALGVGRTFQNLGLARNLSVFDNLLLAQHTAAPYGALAALTYTGATGEVEDELRRRAAATVAALDFDGLAHRPVKHLSGGQQRIVEMACALITAPELLMLDEPSAGMAPAAVENLAVRLREVRDDLGRTVLLIEHNIPLVLDVCDEVYVLDAGRVLAHGTPDEIVREPAVLAAYLGGEAEAVEPVPA